MLKWTLEKSLCAAPFNIKVVMWSILNIKIVISAALIESFLTANKWTLW